MVKHVEQVVVANKHKRQKVRDCQWDSVVISCEHNVSVYTPDAPSYQAEVEATWLFEDFDQCIDPPRGGILRGYCSSVVVNLSRPSLSALAIQACVPTSYYSGNGEYRWNVGPLPGLPHSAVDRAVTLAALRAHLH